jgi:hypothetical protein
MSKRLAPREPVYGMFSPQGNIAVQRVLRLIENEILLGQTSRDMLADRIRVGLKYVAYQADGTGHREVYETRVQEDIEDEINRICLRQGWKTINHWDW